MRFLLATAASLTLGSSLLAQTPGPIDVNAMLAGLQDLKQKQADSARHQLAQTISDFTAAYSDDAAALDFYIEAIRVTRFVGRDDADSTFDVWKKAMTPRLNAHAIATALRYTTLSLQRAAGGTDAQMFPVLFAYTEDTQAHLPSLLALPDAGDQPTPQRGYGERHGERNTEGGGPAGPDPGERIMEEDVSQNVFARWYDIGDELSQLKDWEPVPANVDAMYQKFLLPIMRKNRDPRLLQYWDNRIISERGVASSETAEFSSDHYNSTTRPALLWGRAEDEILIGQRDQGITDMYGLVKAFPAHPDAGKWITELEGLLAPPPAVAAGGTAPATP